MIQSSVARRYAKALFESVDAPTLDPALGGLTGLGDALSESTHLKHVLASPVFSEQDKLAVLSALTDRLGGPPALNGLLALLVKKNRIRLLPQIATAFAALADEAKGSRRVSVVTAKPLRETEQQGLRSRLRDVFRHEVLVLFETDPDLVSGLQIRVGSTVIDSTVRTRLSAMRALLTKES